MKRAWNNYHNCGDGCKFITRFNGFSFQCIDTKVSAPVDPANCSRPYLLGVLIMETITSLLELGSGHLRLEDVNNCVYTRRVFYMCDGDTKSMYIIWGDVQQCCPQATNLNTKLYYTLCENAHLCNST